jgi:coiled-coil domain-containing protein 55
MTQSCQVSLSKYMKVSFTLQGSKPKGHGASPSLKRPAAFSSVDDGEHVDSAATLSGSHDAAVNKKLLAQNVEMSRTMKKKMDAEKKVDETVYEYDEVWDRMQEAKQRQKELKETDARERKVRQHTSLIDCSLISRYNAAEIHSWPFSICSNEKPGSPTS